MRTSFTCFLLHRLPLREVSEWFPRYVFNDLYRQDLERIFSSETLDKDVSEDLAKVKDLDLVGYVDSSLRRSGFADWELDEAVSDILVRLLVEPGPLVKRWDRKSPMSARLKVAIKNQVITAAKNRQRRAKRFQELPDAVPSRPCQDDVGTINAFRDSLRSQYGDAHVRVLDVRLAGNDIKGLIGSEGIPSAYALKRIVQDIKHFVVGWGDSCLERAVSQMQVKEEETLVKRFGRKDPFPATR
jgi:hypothetical protein